MNVWLSDANTISAIYPSYLLRAFQLQPKFTNDLRQANMIIGGRQIAKIPENFSGMLIGVGLDRPMTRTLPLTKIVNLLGRKTAECLLGSGSGGNTDMIMGDPLLLADFVYQKLLSPPGGISASSSAVSASALTIVLRNESERKHVEHLGATAQILVGLNDSDSLLDFFGRISTAKAVVTSDPDTMAVALSFNVPCAAMSFGSADLFVWKDLFSVLSNNGRDLVVKRMKPVTTVSEILKSWGLKTQPFGEMKILKANLLHQLEGVFQRKVSTNPTAPQKSQIILRKATATALSSPPLPSLSQTQPIIPMKRLNPTWVVNPSPPELPSLVPQQPAPPQPNSARSRAASSVGSSRDTSSHKRSKSLMKTKPRKKNIISHETPKSM